MKCKIKNQIWLAIALALIYSAVFIYLCVTKYYTFGYNGSDLAIINQVFYSLVNGKAFYSSFLNHSYLGDHINAVIFLLLPIYALAQHPITLLVIQVISIAASGVILFLAAREKLRATELLSSRLAEFFPVLIMCWWLLNPFIQRINLFEFHFLTLAPVPLFLIALTYWKKTYMWFVVSLIAAVCIREELALVVMLVAFVAVLERRAVKWWLTPIIIGAAAFMTTSFIINIFSPIGLDRFNYYYGWLTGAQGVTNVVQQLVLLVLHLGNIEYVLGLLLPFLIFPFIAKRWSLSAVPLVAGLILFGGGISALFLFMHYSTPVFAIFTIATVDGLARIAQNQSRLSKSWYRDIIPMWPVFISAALVMLIIIFNPLYNISSVKCDAQPALIIAQQQQLIELIPKSASILVSDEPMALLSTRSQYFSVWLFLNGKQLHSPIPYELPEPPDYILVDESELVHHIVVRESKPESSPGILRLRTLISSEGYALIQTADTWWLFAHPRTHQAPINKQNQQTVQLVGPACNELWEITYDQGLTYHKIIPCTPWTNTDVVQTTVPSDVKTVTVRPIKTLQGGLELDSQGTVFFKQDLREYTGDEYHITLTNPTQ